MEHVSMLNMCGVYLLHVSMLTITFAGVVVDVDVVVHVPHDLHDCSLRFCRWDRRLGAKKM